MSSVRKALVAVVAVWHLMILADELSAMDQEILKDLDFYMEMEMVEDQELLLEWDGKSDPDGEEDDESSN